MGDLERRVDATNLQSSVHEQLRKVQQDSAQAQARCAMLTAQVDVAQAQRSEAEAARESADARWRALSRQMAEASTEMPSRVNATSSRCARLPLASTNALVKCASGSIISPPATNSSSWSTTSRGVWTPSTRHRTLSRPARPPPPPIKAQ